MAGLKTPRPSCEIYGGDGENVLNGSAKVISKSGKDLSLAYIKGAQFVLEQVIEKHGIERAVLKSGSPSC